jgi:hypothetical protein
MKARFIAACFLILLAACGSFPTEIQVARRYARENRGRKVVDVSTSTETDPTGNRVLQMDFRIRSTNSAGADSRTDHASYWQAAEAVVHDQSW